MTGSSQIWARVRSATAMIAMLALSACVTVPPEPPPVEQPVPIVVQPAPVEPVEPAPVIPDQPVVVAPPKTLPSVAVVLSSRHPAYERVAIELAGQLDNYTLFDLSDKSQPPVSAFHKIEDSTASAVVAVGLRAAISAKAMSKVPVVFCQVFNIAQYELITANSRGVSSLPPLSLQIAAWKKIDPSLKSIGAIVGEGHEDLIAEAELAAMTHDIELHIRTAKSDRETLYLFNRLVGDIDGFWLFPDNRVLSKPVLQEMMNYAARHRVQMSVFNESLLPMGASISSTSVVSDIASTVMQILRQISEKGVDSVRDISPLNDIRIVTNDDQLQKLIQPAVTAKSAALTNRP